MLWRRRLTGSSTPALGAAAVRLLWDHWKPNASHQPLSGATVGDVGGQGLWGRVGVHVGGAFPFPELESGAGKATAAYRGSRDTLAAVG